MKWNNKDDSEVGSEEGKKKSWISYILGGRILTENFIIKQSWLLFLIFCMILAFISNRYSCSKKLTEMDKLKKELAELNYEQVILTTRLTATSSQIQIEEMLRANGIELSKGSNPIYQIHK